VTIRRWDRWRGCRVRRGAGGLDRRLGNAGGGCLAVAAFALVGPLVVISWSVFTNSATVLWLLCLLAATAVHLLYARSRLDAWRRRPQAPAA
jgi:nitrate/nitrite transporter NarK